MSARERGAHGVTALWDSRVAMRSQGQSREDEGNARADLVPSRPFADDDGQVSPARFIVDLTRRCNLRCGFCSSRSDTPDTAPELPAAVLLDLLRTAEARGAFEVTLTGGEPLAWTGLAAVAAAGSPLDFTSLQIATNATLVDERCLALVAALAPRRVRVSLDGPPEVHDAVRGQGSFAVAFAGLRRLRTIVDQVEVVTVLQGEGVERWPELTARLAAEGVAAHELCAVQVAPDAPIRAPTAEQMIDVVAEAAERQASSPPGFSLRVASSAPLSSFGAPPRSAPISELINLHFRGLYVWVQPDGEMIRGAPGDALRPFRHHHLGNLVTGRLARRLDGQPLRVSNMTSVPVTDASWSHPATVLGSPFLHHQILAQHLSDNPRRFRVRSDERAALVFDTETFLVHVLSPEEAHDCGIARQQRGAPLSATRPW